MGLSSKSSSPDSVSSGPDDDLENDTSDSDSESNQHAEDDSQSEEAGSEVGSAESSEEDGEDSVNTSAKIIGKKRKLQEAEGESIEEEKVLSHAEKRRQMKREQQKLKAQPAAESKTQKRKKSAGADVSAAGPNAKRQNSVWVGNLSYKTTVDDLKTFFADAGEVSRINMPTKVLPGPARKFENRGCASPYPKRLTFNLPTDVARARFAYVDFVAPEAKTRAIAMSEQHLIGRKLLIKDGAINIFTPVSQ